MLLYKQVATNEIKLSYCEEKVNGVPTPYKKITEDEYRELKYRWHNDYTSYEQIHRKEQLLDLFGEDSGYAEAHCEFNNDYGVAEIIKMYTNERVYVKIGCKHEWEYVDGDKFSTKHRCKKCGTVVETPTGY